MIDLSPPLAQKTIGILGGMSNHATAQYYAMLNTEMAKAHGGAGNHLAELVIVSVDYGNIELFVFNDRWIEAQAYLAEKLDRLEAARPDIVLCASNSMHLAFEPVIEARDTPYIHIADATGAAMRQAGMSRVGLLGTRFTMGSPQMRTRYAQGWGIDVIVPDAAGQAIASDIILGELCHGLVTQSGHAILVAEIERLKARGAQGIILGCTELCLTFTHDTVLGLPVFDTTGLHVKAAVDFVMGDQTLVMRGRGHRLDPQSVTA